MKSITLKIFITIALMMLNSCNVWKPSDASKVPANAKERVKKNMEEGRGFRLKNIGKQKNTFQFASSNEMWRASLDILDFAPLNNADYSGGLIITDWFSLNNEEENKTIKITVKFLSNEIRSDGLEIIIHEKKCNQTNNCKVNKVVSNINEQLKLKILKKAATLKIQDTERKKSKDGEYKVVQ